MKRLMTFMKLRFTEAGKRVSFYLKCKLSFEQKQFLKKAFKVKNRDELKQVHLQVKKLQGLGFTDSPLRALHSYLTKSNRPEVKRAAGRQLITWYVNQDDLNAVNKCLEILPYVKQNENDPLKIKQNAIIEADCLRKLNNLNSGKSIIIEALQRIGPNADLYLAMANFEFEANEKLKWTNAALKSKGISPFSINPQYNQLSLSLLNKLSTGSEKSLLSVYLSLPLVSIIMAVYNEEHSVSSAIESIINQTWPNLEILVVDDCSTDKTIEIVKNYEKKDTRISLLSTETNSGPYVARNIAFKMATGDFITCHDADDWSHPEKIEKQVSCLMAEPKIIGNTSQMARTDANMFFYRANATGDLIAGFRCSFMFQKKKVIEKVGYWDSVRFSADSEYIRRIKKAFGKGAVVKLKTGPLSFYRKTGSSLTGNKVFGYPGFYMGARKEYFEAQSYYHNKSDNLFFFFPQRERPFPVPEPMWSKRENTEPHGRRFFKIVIGTDFRKTGKIMNSLLEIIDRYRENKVPIGLIQISDYNYSPDMVICSNIRDLIDGKYIQMLVYGEMINCEKLFIYDPLVLLEKQRYLADIRADEIKVINIISSFIGKRRQKRITNIAECNRNLQDYFGRKGTWCSVKVSEMKKMHSY